MTSPSFRRFSSETIGSSRFWYGFLASCALLFALDHFQELTNSVVNAGAIYQRLLTTGFKPLYPRKTIIVEIRNGREPTDVTLANICQQRLFLSRLLNAIGDPAVAPAAIVIDKYFSHDACTSMNTCSPAASCDGTPKLEESVQALLDKNVPIIVGRLFEYQESRTPPLKLLSALEFSRAATKTRVIEGAVNLDDDNRRVALRWTGRREADDDSIINMDTIGFRAALTSDPKLLEVNSRLNGFYAESRGPFVGFLPSGAFGDYTFSAIEVLCGKGSGPKTDWQSCSSPDQQAIARMRGRIVLVGENFSGVDQHDTVVGPMAGVQLWANYIEAIFDENMFRQIPDLMTYLFGFIVFLSLEFAGRAFSSYRKAAAIAGFGIAVYFLCYLAVRLTGYYLNPAVGVFGVALSQLGRWAASRLSSDAGDQK